MFTKKLLYGATLGVAALAAGFTGTSASAGGCGYGGGYYYGGYHGGHGGYSHTYRDRGYTHHRSRDYRSGRHYTHRERVTVHRHGNVHVREHVTHHQPPPRYRRVYHPPVYRTYYDACGYPYRVMVRAGYYERVRCGY